MAEQMTYNIQFKAQAEGLDKIIKQVTEIAGTKSIKLTDGMQKDLTKLQNRWEAFQQSLTGQLDNKVLGKDTLKSLSNEFIKIVDLAKKLSLEMSSVALPAETSKQLKELNDKLKEAQRLRTNTRSRIRTSQSLLTDKGTGTVKAQQKAFNRARGSQLSGKGNQVFQSADEVRAYRSELESQVGVKGLSVEKVKALTAEIQELTDWLGKYEAILLTITDDANNKIAADRKELANNEQQIASIDAQIEKVNQQIQASKKSNITEDEAAQIATQLVQATQELNSVRTAQIANTENELDARSEANKRAKEEERIAKQVEEQQRKNNQTSKDATDATNKLTQATSKSNNVFTRAAKTVISYGTVLSLLRRGYNETLKTITEMDEALTGMAVVTSMSREQTWDLVDSFQELATQTGKTTTEIANMATKFYQQGKSTTQVLQLTEAAAKAATIAGIDGSRSIDLLTNAMNGFQLSSSEAMAVSDKFAALAAASATDYEELAVALSKVAAQANLAGMSMDFTLGLLAKGVETTREAPETIGTALKTVISRMRELTDYEDTLSDGTDVNRVEKALSNIGVELRDSEGQFRDLEVVLTEVGSKWDTLNKNQQANVAVALAGTRQQSRLIAMMQDFDRTLELVDTSANSYGATMSQSAKYMEGLEAKTTLLTTAWQKLITTITNSELIIGVVKTLTKLVEGLTSMISSGWIVPFLVIGGLMGTMAIGQKAYNKQVQRTAEQLRQQQELETRRQEAQNQALITKTAEVQKLTAETQELEKQIALQEQFEKVQQYNAVNKKLKGAETDEDKAKYSAEVKQLEEEEAVKKYLNEKQTLKTKQQSLLVTTKEKQQLEQQVDATDESKEAKFEAWKLGKKTLKQQQEETLEQKKQNLEAATELVTKAKEALIQAKAEGNQEKIAQATQDYNDALGYQQEMQIEYNNEVNKQFSAMVTESGAIGLLWQNFSGILSTIVPILTTVNALTKIATTLANKEYRQKLKTLAVEKIKAAWAMAHSAATIPVVGWAIGLGILAAAGIAIAVSATKAANGVSDATTNTTDSLNSMQAELYNLNNSITTVSGLADEFEELNNKIVKTADDTKRLAEIIQEVNDAAGYTLISSSASDNEAEILIKGYEASLRRQKAKKVGESSSALTTGLKDLAKAQTEQENFWSNFGIIAGMTVGGAITGGGLFGLGAGIATAVSRNQEQINKYLESNEFRQQYIDSLGDAGKNTIRNIAINQLDGLAEASAETQEFIQNAFYESAAKWLDVENNTFNTQGFAAQFGDFKNFIKELDAAGENGSFSKYAETLKKVNAETLNCLTSSNAFLASVMELKKAGLIGLCDQLGLTVDEFNNLYDVINKFGGEKTNEILKNLVSNSGGNKITLYKQLAAEINAAANSVDTNNLQNYQGYQTLSTQANNKEAEIATLKAEVDKLKKDENKVEEYQKVNTEYLKALGELEDIQKDMLYYTDPDAWAEGAKKEAQSVLLVDNAVSDYTDSLTKLKSTFENLSKISDWTATDFSDKMDLLNDYPELLKSIESGTLDAASAMAFYSSKFKENRDLLDNDLQSTAAKYSDKTGWLANLGLGGIFDGSDESYALIQDILLNQSKYKAKWGLGNDAFTSLWSDISAYGQKQYLLRQMEAEGISTVMGIDFDLTGEKAAYNWKANIAGQLATELEYLDKSSAEYKAKSKEYINALREQVEASKALAKDVEPNIRTLFGGIEDEDYQAIRASFTLANGELSMISDAYSKLTKDQQDMFKTQVTNLQSLAESHKEAYDQMCADAETLAQAEIDQQTAVLEAQIEALEERRDAYENYFNELDNLQEEEENAETHDSLVNQIAALSGALDGQSKAKIKELQSELEDLKEEELQNQRERQQDALLDSIDNETEKLNKQMETLNDSLSKLMAEYLPNLTSQPSAVEYGSNVASTVANTTGSPNTNTNTATSSGSGAGSLTIGSIALNLTTTDGKTVDGSQLVEALTDVLKQYGITVNQKA